MLHAAHELLETLQRLNGFYECPKDPSGRRLGPLVGYAGRDAYGRQFVGDIYANFARIEGRPQDLYSFARELAALLLGRDEVKNINVYCGAPEGGKTLAVLLTLLKLCRYIYPEKKILALATGAERERSKLFWGRHEIYPGDRVVIVEDVMNNFSTTTELVQLIETSGGEVVAITGLLNRSLTIGDTFTPGSHTPIPVVALLRKPIPEYTQDDPAVAEDVARGNVVWKPKTEWLRLMEAMNAHRK